MHFMEAAWCSIHVLPGLVRSQFEHVDAELRRGDINEAAWDFPYQDSSHRGYSGVG